MLTFNPGAGFAKLDLSILNRNHLPAPPLDLAIFGSWAEWIAATAECKNAPIDYVAWSLVGGAAGLLGATRWVSPWEGWSEPCVLWIALLGDPSANKSPALDPIRDAIVTIESDAGRQYDEDERNKIRLIINDATVEAAASVSADNLRGVLLLKDELAAWLGNLDKYGDGDAAFYLAAYGARPHTIDRKKLDKPIRIPSLAISILGAIQPEPFSTLLLTRDDDGLQARILAIWPDPVPPKRPSTIPDHQRVVRAFRRLHSCDFRAIDGKTTPITLVLEPCAADEFHEWREVHHEQSQSTAGLLASSFGKMPGLVLRIALVLEYLEWANAEGRTSDPAQVTLPTLRRALALVEGYLKPMLERAIGDAARPPAERHAAILARALLARGLPPRINAREIRRDWRLPGLRTPAQVDAAIHVLIEAGWLSPAETDGVAGRPSKTYRVNPRIAEEGACRD